MMRKIGKGIYEVCFNLAEAGVVYAATFLGLVWAGNLIKFYSVFLLVLAVFLTIVAIAVKKLMDEAGDELQKVTAGKKIVVEKFKGRTVLPMPIHTAFDVANVLMLVANGWWVTGSMYLLAHLMIRMSANYFRELASKLYSSEETENSKDPSRPPLRFIRPEPIRKSGWKKIFG